MNFDILAERAQDARVIERLLDRAFGADRTLKTVYRLREGLAPIADLRFVAVDPDGALLASLRFWSVRVGGRPAILLGPLAVEPALQGRGIGRALVRHGLIEARRRGHRLCLVVGDPDYYTPYGFVNAPALGLVLPGPVELRRFQVLELKPGALTGVTGQVARAEAAAPAGRKGLRGGAVA